MDMVQLRNNIIIFALTVIKNILPISQQLDNDDVIPPIDGPGKSLSINVNLHLYLVWHIA